MSRRLLDDTEQSSIMTGMANVPKERRCTVRQAAEMAGVSRQRIHQLIDAGDLIYDDRWGRFELDAEQVREWANQDRHPGPKKKSVISS